MKGYKAFNSDWTCRGYQYQVGETFFETGILEMCHRGLHFSQKLTDVFGFYPFDEEKCVVAEIEATGDVIQGASKCCTNELRIIRQLSWEEVRSITAEEFALTKRHLQMHFVAALFYGLLLILFQSNSFLYWMFAIIGSLIYLTLPVHWMKWPYLFDLYEKIDPACSRIAELIVPSIIILATSVCIAILHVYLFD